MHRENALEAAEQLHPPMATGIGGVVAGRVSPGRPPATTCQKIVDVAFDLFDRQGFDRTTVEEIAGAAGIGRRTFFRYFSSKNDVVWDDFGSLLERLALGLDSAPPDEPVFDAIRRTVVAATLDYSRADLPTMRRRIELITTVPALQSHSVRLNEAWRRILAEFAGRRLGQQPEDLLPQTIAYACLGATMAANREWIRWEGTRLRDHLDRAFGVLAIGFADLPEIT